MSDIFYPALPGLQYPVTKESLWVGTNFQTSVSGRESGVSYETFPRWLITLKYEFLREGLGRTEMSQLAGFFNSRTGDLDDFLFTDPDESAVSAQQFGVGDGTTTDFALVRPFGSFLEPVGYGVPSSVTVNGSPTVLYSMVAGRLVRFNTAPSAGATLRWTGTYAYRVRFADPKMTFEKFMHQLWSNSKVQLLSRKP